MITRKQAQKLLDTPFDKVSGRKIKALKIYKMALFGRVTVSDDDNSRFGLQRSSSVARSIDSRRRELTNIEMKLVICGQVIVGINDTLAAVNQRVAMERQHPMLISLAGETTVFDRELKALKKVMLSNPWAVYAVAFQKKHKKLNQAERLELYLDDEVRAIANDWNNRLTKEARKYHPSILDEATLSMREKIKAAHANRVGY